MKKTLLLLISLGASSCATTVPKQPDPFDVMLIDAAKEMFEDVDFSKP